MVFLCTFEFYCNKITSTNRNVVICMQQPMRRLETLVFKFWHFFYFSVHVNSHVQRKAIYCSQFVCYLGIENIGYTYLWVYLKMYIISNITSHKSNFESFRGRLLKEYHRGQKVKVKLVWVNVRHRIVHSKQTLYKDARLN